MVQAIGILSVYDNTFAKPFKFMKISILTMYGETDF